MPRQVKRFPFIVILFKRQKIRFSHCSLYEELIAQRALDRRLAEQLIQFKTTVGTLMLYVDIMLARFSWIYSDDFETRS